MEKRALTLALSALLLLAGGMWAFYHFQKNRSGFESADFQETELTPAAAAMDALVGLYSPADGPLEAQGHRIAFFTVNRRDEGGYLGSVKVDTVGSGDSLTSPCLDVRLEEGEFFLRCGNQETAISLNGHWKMEDGVPRVSGKVLWTNKGDLWLDVNRAFQFVPAN